MAKRKTHKEDRRGWPLFNRLLAGFIELTRFPELPEQPKQGKNYEYWPEGALCANGNPYHGCIRLGSTNKLIIGFSGGGVSVDEHTAARPQRVGGKGEMFYSDDVRFGDVILRMGTFGQSKKESLPGLEPAVCDLCHRGFPLRDRGFSLYGSGRKTRRAASPRLYKLSAVAEKDQGTGAEPGADFGDGIFCGSLCYVTADRCGCS